MRKNEENNKNILQNVLHCAIINKRKMKMCFEWDTEKEIKNIQKHGISFPIAARVFLDPNRIELYDAVHSMEEDRYHVIGVVDEVLVVIYTERGSHTRLISARVATKREKEMYYGNCEI